MLGGTELAESSAMLELEHVIPVVCRRAEAFDSRIQSDHGGGHVVAGGVGVEAAVDRVALVQEGLQPMRVGPGTGSGKAPAVGMQSKTTERIDSRLTKDDRAGSLRGAGATLERNSKAAQVLLRAGSQATPGPGGGAAQLGTDWEIFLSE